MSRTQGAIRGLVHHRSVRGRESARVDAASRGRGAGGRSLPRVARGRLAVYAPTVGAIGLALVGLAVAVHMLFLQALLPHSYDIDSFYAPSWEFLAHNLRAGSLPEWNPYAFGGAGFTGDPQSQALYPPTLLLFSCLSLPTATLGWFAFHYLLAAAGTFCLARNLTLAPSAAAIAAVGYAGSTYLVARAQAPTLLTGAAWMPVVLAAALSYRFREPVRRARPLNVLLALSFALLALSGSQQVFLLTAAACIAVSIVDARRDRIVTTLASLFLGGVMAAPQLLPLAFLVRDSTAVSGINAGGLGALSWRDRSILAGAFSHTVSETAPIYLGALGAGQALVATLIERTRTPARIIMTMAALSLVWAFGIVGDLVAPLVPPLATVTSHQPVRALPLAVLAFALAIGLYWNERRSQAQALAAVGVSAASFLLAGTLGPVSAPVLGVVAVLTVLVMYLATRLPRIAALPVVFALLLAADLAIHNVNLRNTHQRPAVWESASKLYPAPPETARLLRARGVSRTGPRFAWLATKTMRQRQLGRALSSTGQLLLMDGGSLRYELPALSGYNPIIDRAYRREVRRSNGRAIGDRHFIYFTKPATPLLRAFSIRYYLCTPTVCPTGLRTVWTGHRIRLVEDRKALPYARLSRGNGATTTVEALRAIATTDTIEVGFPSAHPHPAGTISVSTRLDDGWRATIDGHDAPVRSGAFGVMSVRVRAGWRTARFIYSAPGFRVGLLLAACALLACVVATATSRRWLAVSMPSLRRDRHGSRE